MRREILLSVAIAVAVGFAAIELPFQAVVLMRGETPPVALEYGLREPKPAISGEEYEKGVEQRSALIEGLYGGGLILSVSLVAALLASTILKRRMAQRKLL